MNVSLKMREFILKCAIIFTLIILIICDVQNDDQHVVYNRGHAMDVVDARVDARADTRVNAVNALTHNNNNGDHKLMVSDDNNRIKPLSEDPLCADDIRHICVRNGIALDNNFAVLNCLQNDNRKEDFHLSEKCHHLIWTFKRNLTHHHQFASLAKRICKRFIESNPECVSTEHESVSSPGSNLLSCLIEKITDTEPDAECKSFLNKMELIIFSDYRLIHRFTDNCLDDIEKFKCGRLEMNSEATHSQGETIGCLQQNMDKLQDKCKHQILRIAEFQSDDFHLDRPLFFACRDDREHFCPKVHAGEGRVYKCLMRHRLERDLSRECREKLFQREMLAVHDYKVSHGLAKACKGDIKAYHCREDTSDQKEIRLAQILTCLESALSKNYPIAGECRNEMLAHRKYLFDNFQLTPDLVASCDSDIVRFCSRLEHNGKTLHCLMSHARRPRRRGEKGKDRINDECRRGLEDLLKQVNIAEDWRVDTVLQESCQNSVDKLCKTVQPGDGQVMSCLMDHVDSSNMDDECRENLLQIQYFVSRDFELDIPLYRSCHDDAMKHCHAKRDWHDKPDRMDPERGPSVLSCLYRYAYHPKENVRLSHQCLFDLHRVMKQRAVSVDLHPEIEEPCLGDLAKYCSNDNIELNKRGAEMECLQENYEALSKDCRIAIGNFTEEESEHLELNSPLFIACENAIKEACSDSPSADTDRGDIIECLILNKNKPAIRKYPKCRTGIEHFQLLSLKDFRFSFKFKEACKDDVLTYCRTVKTKYEVIACLSTIVFNDTMSNRQKYRVSRECKNQLKFELLQRSENINFDPNLEKACHYDREHYCKELNPGESNVIECLKINFHKLKKMCQKLLFKLERIEMGDNSIDYSLLTNCKNAINKLCANTELKEVLFCLRDHRDDAKMDHRCRSLILKRLVEQNSDYRLNPHLKSACQKDIPKFCAEIIEYRKPDEQLEGKVIACLKKQYIANKLSQSCEIEIVNVIREVAENVELDPILYKECQNDIKLKCADETDVQECLKMKFQNKEITSDSCKKQVALLISEVKADIQSDPLLYKVCVHDIKNFCADIPAGHGRQLSCLLAAHESSSLLSEECKTMLSKRVEMFEYAAQVVPAESVGEVMRMVVASPSRNYFLFVALSIIGTIFIGGLLCGRVTKRIPNSVKNK